MTMIHKLFRFLNLSNREEKEYNTGELRREFKVRYHHFKLLLKANSKALEVMTEIEEALQGSQAFGVNYIQALCTRITANVLQIIKNLTDLAPGKYERLNDKFTEIRALIESESFPVVPDSNGQFILPLHEADIQHVDQIGNKMANLGEIKNRIQLKVPDGFIFTASAYHRFMDYNDLEPEINRRIQTAGQESLDRFYKLSSSIQQLIIAAPLPEDLEAAIQEHLDIFRQKEGPNMNLVMRSSAQGEDTSGRSFAGQYRSDLNVSSDNISQVYKEILASKYSLPAMTYRLNRGIPDRDVSMSVGCMAMVNAVSSGVAYTRNPLDIRDESTTINSVWGLPKPVVDGSVLSDLFVISRDDPPDIIKKEIAIKKEKFICYPEEGVCRLDASGDEESGMPSLDDRQAIELALLTRQIEDYYGQPQDIEWALEADGSIVFLQSRPLKQMEAPEITEKPPVPDEKQHEVIFTGGISASPGAGAGPVFMVNRDADAFQFPEGAVLVTPQALPRWAFLLNRAAAVVTGQGGVTGHLANVAREFKVPALFGVEEGIAELKQGERVTVDADGLRIYKGDIEDLLTLQVKPVNLMEGSPVYAILKDVARHITPLNLLDPDAASFRVRECQTLHDITRYGHEKAVHEMFQFGKKHHFPERSSKQLFYEVPMQWWILNLDDGFKEEEEDKYIRLENIVSIPMLALWEGITAIPWQGPPAIDAKGFMSVMFQATINRGLTQGVRSPFADRNYFMISKNYCSLTSRLGFHFSLVEAMVGERLTENYTSFQYKGGAADIERRGKRLHLLKDILDENGFSATISQDSLIARVEGLDQESMKKKLKILGYLLIHTRQIDMIMSNSASVEFYRSKMEKEIRDLTG